MASKKLRKVKEVNGWKINHPHSAANLFYMFFSLILIASPCAFLFLYAAFNGVAADSFNGIDLVKFGLTYVMGLAKGSFDGVHTTPLMIDAMYNCGEFLQPAMPYLYLSASGILWLMIVFSVVLLIVWVVYLIKGYLKHSRVMRVFCSLDFTLAILYCVIFLTIYIVLRISNPEFIFFIWQSFYALAGLFVLLIIIASMYSINFKDSIPESKLEYHEDTPTVEHVTKVHEVTKIKYEGSNTLPPNLTNIGGHAFAENQNLVVANIPLNITKLGGGAFANCLKLKVVSIPKSVTEIGFNCFFNCVELERINYAGTKEEWKKIARGSNWLAKAKTSEVVCIDGTVIVNPYH